MSCKSGDLTDSAKKRFVQAFNPSTNRWVKIDRDRGRIVSNKKTPGPYKNVTKYTKSK